MVIKVKVAGFSVSLDGFAAGTEQGLDHPLGKRGDELFQWYLPTRTFRAMFGQEGGDTGLDDDFGKRSMEGFGAFILGRNMFGPIRGNWRNDDWKGWWGDNPPYHEPTFVVGAGIRWTQFGRVKTNPPGGRFSVLRHWSLASWRACGSCRL